MHEKFTKKGGKSYGPYLYENKRVDGKVVTNYVGKKENSLDVYRWILVFIGCFILLAGGFYIYEKEFSPTAKVSFELDLSYKQGEPLQGDMRFKIKEGELVPKNSMIKIEYGNQSKSVPLSDLISDQTVSGDYYAENAQISGNGEGYGVKGTKISYPTLDFEMRVYRVSGETSDESIAEGNTEVGNSEGSSEGGVTGEDDNEIVPSDETSTEMPSGTEEVTPTEGSTAEGNDAPASSDSESAGSSESSGSSSSEGSSDSGESSGDSGSSSSSEGSSASSGGSEGSSSGSVESSGGITGEVIGEDEFVVEGKVSHEKDFSYNLEEDQRVEIVSGSVKVNGESVPDGTVKLNVDDGKAVVSTDYFVSKEGFGEEFLGDYAMTLHVDVSKLNLIAEPGVMGVNLEHEGSVVASYSEDVAVQKDRALNLTERNVTEVSEDNSSVVLLKDFSSLRIPYGESAEIDLSDYFVGAENYEFVCANISAELNGDILTLTPDEGFKGARKAKITAVAGDVKLEGNEFSILVSSGAVKVTTTREKIVVGEKVRWVKNVSMESPENVSIEIPVSAENVSVKKFGEFAEENPDDVDGRTITGQVTIEVDLKKEPWLTKFLKNVWKSITGMAISDLPDDEFGEETKSLELEGDANSYIIEYETPAPSASEKEIANGKQVVISGPEDVTYTDVIASAELNNSVKVDEQNKIKVYWLTEEVVESVKDVSDVPNVAVVDEIDESSIAGSISGNVVAGITTRAVRKEMPFDAYDLDEDGNVDYVEWVVPHLSNQTFEIIIEISKAEHLNSARESVEDVYDLVKAKDGVYSSIPVEDYVRVVFVKNLTSSNDITFYGKSSGVAGVEVYEKDGTSAIARFDNVQDDKMYKVYLSSLSGEQDTFDLKVLGGEVEFDYIVDPSSFNVSGCASLDQENGVYTLNQSINTASDCIYIQADNITLDGNGFNITNTGVGENGIYIFSGRENTAIRNINIISFPYAILDGSGSAARNSLIYNNSFGEIRWTQNSGNCGSTWRAVAYCDDPTCEDVETCEDPSLGCGSTWYGANTCSDSFCSTQATCEGAEGFTQDLTVTGNLTFPGRIVIGNNSVYLNSSAFAGQKINSSANITLYGLSTTFVSPYIAKDGVACTDCYNFTSLNAGTVVFNVTSWSSYSIMETTSSDTTAPNISFVGDTPATGSSQTTTSMVVNVSSSDNNGSHYVVNNFDNSLVGWWRMDDANSSTAFDYFGKNNGSLVGAVINSSSGRFGNGSWFDGKTSSGASISFGSDFIGVGAKTFCAWVYPLGYGASGSGRIIDNGKYLLLMDGTTRLAFYSDGSTTARSVLGSIPLGVWKHACVVRNDSGATNFYIDSALSGTANQSSGTPVAGTTNVAIGNRIARDRTFNGSIDEVMIFNRSLSAGEIQALYNASATKYYNNFTSLSDGTHTFKAYAVDTSGNLNSTELRSVSVDGNAPNVSFVEPTPANNANTTNSSHVISVNVTESNLKNLSYSWNGTSYSVYDDSLVLFMNFDNRSALGENATFVRDLSRWGNNGTPTNGAFYNSSGKYNGGYQFDGVNDYVNLTGLASTSGKYSFGMWVKSSAVNATDKFLLDTESGRLVLGWYSGNGSGNIGYNDGSWHNFGATPNDGSWHNLFFVFNATKGVLYLDGVQYGLSQDYTPRNLGGKVSIGSRYSANLYYFNGSIDDVMIFNRSLTASEIQNLYQTSLTKYSSNTWGLYVNQTNLTTGNYTYSATVYDILGLTGTTGERVLNVLAGDVTAPQINITSPTNTTYTVSSINFNVASNENLSLCKFTLDNWITNNTMTLNASLTGANYTNSSIANGGYASNFWCNDTSGNINNSQQVSFGVNVDYTAPNISFVGDTPASGSSQTATSMVVNVSSSDNNGEHYVVNNFDNSLVGWWRMDDVNASGDPTDISGHCYDNETEILTLREIDCEELSEEEINSGEYVVEYYDNEGEIINGNGDFSLVRGLSLEDDVIVNDEEIISDEENLIINNNLDKENKKGSNAVTRTVSKSSQDYVNFNDNSYINFSVDNNYAEDGAVTGTVSELSQKQYLLPRSPGSTPGRTASAFSKKCFVKEWKYFAELDGEEKVATLNKETGETEYQLPTEKQEFDNINGEMYKIELEDGSELVVSEKHKVYSSNENKDYLMPSISNKSLGDKTLTFVCSFNSLSPENIGQSSFIANAKYGESLKFSSTASGNLSMNSDKGMNVTCFLIKDNVSINSSLDKWVSESSLAALLSSSYDKNSGAVNSNLPDILFSSNTLKQLPFVISAETTTLTSTISSIYTFFDFSSLEYLSAREKLISSDNLSACSWDNFDLETILLILANSSNSSLSFLATTNCQFILFINASSFNSSGMRIVTSSMENIGDLNYINVAKENDFSLIPIIDAFDRVNNGSEIYFLNSNNEEVKIKSISKIDDYFGKIYDVDVPNDIVLVRRDGSAFWSGNSNNGSKVGGVVINSSSGRFGNGSWFDGTDDYISLPNSQTLNVTNFTVSAWINFRGFKTYNGLISASSGAYIGRRADTSQWRVAYINGSGSIRYVTPFSAAFSTNEWKHVIFIGSTTSSGNFNISYYLNGTLIGSVNYSEGYTSPRWNNIGSISGTGDYFNGSIDEVMIFNRSLSLAEIKALYNASATKYYNNFTSLSDGTHTFKAYAVDTSGNLNNTETRSVSVDGSAPALSFVAPTPANNVNTTNSSEVINVSITESNLKTLNYTWNGTSYSVYDDSLVLFMNFDNRSALGENQTFVRDLSRYGNNGTTAGNSFANMTGGKYVGGLQLDGNGDYINTGNYKISGSAGTVSAWFKTNSNSAAHRQILSQDASSDGNCGLCLQATENVNGKIRFSTTPSRRLYGPIPQIGIWYHVVGTWSNIEGMKLYVNGVLNSSNVSDTSSPTNNSKGLAIGAYTWSGADTQFMNGLIDDVMIFNRSLTASEIQNLYQTSLTKYSSNTWGLMVNQTNLTTGNYTYSATAYDILGLTGTSGIRTLNVVSSGLSVTNISGCMNLSTANMVYVLNQSISSSGTCFNVSADNVIINGNGFNVTGDNSGYGIYLGGSNGTFANLSLINYSAGVYVAGGETGNEIVNLNAENGNTGYSILDLSGLGIYNYLTYYNEFGYVRWTNSSFLENLTIMEDLTFPGKILIENNSISIALENSTVLDSGANITLYGVGERFVQPILRSGSSDCLVSGVCVNYTALNAQTVSYGLSSSGVGLMDSGVSGALDHSVVHCGETDELALDENGVYTLQNDIVSDGTCIIVAANNVTINGNGKTITYSNGTYPGIHHFYGIYSVFNKTNINDLNVSVENYISGTGYKYGIYLSNGRDNTISGVNVYKGYTGINLLNTVNDRLNDINITMSNISAVALVLRGNGTQVENLRIEMNGGTYGMRFAGNDNVLNNFFINSARYGLVFQPMSQSGITNNTLRNGIINGSKNTAIYYSPTGGYSTFNSVFENTSVTSLNSSVYDIHVLSQQANGTQFVDMTGIGNYSISGGNVFSVKNSQYGEVKFLRGVNGAGSNFSNDILIQNNSAYISSSFNSSANISLYGIGNRGFSNPVILKDGVGSCLDCYNFTSLADTNVVFNVTSPGIYSIGDLGSLTSCGTLNIANYVYNLRNNLVSNGNCITISANNITLNGNGFNVTGNGGLAVEGITISADNASITNVSVRGFAYGLLMYSKAGAIISNSLFDSNGNGIFIGPSLGFNISGNTFVNNNYGLDINAESTVNGNIVNNQFNLNNYSLYLQDSDYLNVSGIVVNNSLKDAVTVISPSRHIVLGMGIKNLSVYNTSVGYYDLVVSGAFHPTLSSDIHFVDLINIGNYSFAGNSNLSVVFENSQFGKVEFLQYVNATGTNLSNDIRFANNSIFVNGANRDLAKEANVTYYGIGNRGFRSPIVMRLTTQTLWGAVNYTALTEDNVKLYLSTWSAGGAIGIGEGYSDLTAPSIMIVSPANDSRLTYSNVGINYTISDANAGSVWWTNNSGVNNYSLGWGVNISERTWSEGTQRIIIWANDSYGNVNSTSVSFFVDTIIPQLSIVYPENSTYMNVNVSSINYTASDANLQSCWYSMNNGVVNNSMSCGVNLTGLTSNEGSNTWTIWANDSVGNINYSSVTFLKNTDSIVPLLSYGVGTENNNEVASLSGGIYINITASDENEDKVTFRLFNDSGIINESVRPAGSREITLSGLNAGTYRYNVTVNDSYGNVNNSATRTITLLGSCLNSNCSENNGCLINSNCTLSNNDCPDGRCDFDSLNLGTGVYVYTLYSGMNGNDLTLNLTNRTVRSALNFGSGSRIIFSGKNGTSLTGGSAGGNAGNLTIYVYDLLNTTNARFVGIGGYSTASGIGGGDGGNLILNYHGRIWNFTDSLYGQCYDEWGDPIENCPSNKPTLNGGSNSTGSVTGSIGSILYEKDSRIPRDSDITGDGKVGGADVEALNRTYGLASAHNNFVWDYDINNDSRINVIDLARIGFEWNTR